MRLGTLLIFSMLALGCGDDGTILQDGSGDDEKVSAALAQYGRLVHATYQDTLEATQALDLALKGLADDPSEASLETARQAWLDAREPYLLTEAFRFYDGPIDNPTDGPEGLMNAWPLDEHYIDYVQGDASAGIINDPSQDIRKEGLEALNEAGGEKNIATGYHAIEFLLWGQDMSDTGPGERPYTDFMDGGSADNQDRRRAYLLAVSELLVDNLEGIVAAWAPGEDNYRAQMEAAEPAEGLRRILTGLIILSGFETGGERLQTALDTGDQEDEHSCFSDNTHRDMVQDVQGIQNVYLGRYTRLDGTEIEGPSVHEAVAEAEAELAIQVKDRIEQSLDLAQALRAPFDREIATDNPAGRDRVEALVNSLGKQETVLFDVFSTFELSVEIP